MNRENKLALIIGFALILVVGVLISDHLSRANRDRLDEPSVQAVADTKPASNALLAKTLDTSLTRLASEEPGVRTASARPERERGLLGDRSTPRAIDTTLVIRPQQTTPGPSQIAMRDPDPTEIRQGPSRSALRVGDEEPLGLLASAAGTVLERWHNSATPPLTQTTTDTPRALPMFERVAAEPTRRVLPEPARTIQAQPPAVRAQPEFISYTIQEGDALIRIAREHLGSGNKWTVIRDANPKKIGPEGQVRQGVTIRIPVAGGENATPMSRSRQAKRTPIKPATMRTHTVQEGESLSIIARDLLGSMDRWQEIARLNKIDNPSLLRVGQKLVIPAG